MPNKMKTTPVVKYIRTCGFLLTNIVGSTIFPSWWFQPIWKILVKLGIISPSRGENTKYLKPPTRDLLATTMGTHVSLLPSFLVVNYFTHNFRVCMASSAHLPAPHPQIRLPSEDIPHEAQHDPTEGPRDEGDGEAQPSGDRIAVEEIALNFRLQKASTAIWIFFVCYWLEVLSIGNLRNLCFFWYIFIYTYILIREASTFCWWFNSWPFWDGENVTDPTIGDQKVTNWVTWVCCFFCWLDPVFLMDSQNEIYTILGTIQKLSLPQNIF